MVGGSVTRRAVLLLVFAAVASATCLWRSFAELRAPRTLALDVPSVDKTTACTALLVQQKLDLTRLLYGLNTSRMGAVDRSGREQPEAK
eukprot:jgi/Chlat1/5179/Chrsp33S05166